MLWAEDENGNKMEATPGSEGTCSICGEKVHSKCGEINAEDVSKTVSLIL